MLALLGLANTAARRIGPQTLTKYFERVLNAQSAASLLYNPLLYNSFLAFSPFPQHFLLILCPYFGKPVFSPR